MATLTEQRRLATEIRRQLKIGMEAAEVRNKLAAYAAFEQAQMLCFDLKDTVAGHLTASTSSV